MHIEELKELNKKLWATAPSAKTQRHLAFEERIFAKIRDMSFKGEQIGFVKANDIDVGAAKEFHDLVSSIHMNLLPYFTLTQVRGDVRIDAVKF